MTKQRCAGDAADAAQVTAVRTHQSSWGGPYLLALSLAALTFLAYRPVWRAGFIWDDNSYVTNNTTLRSLDGLRRIWFELGATSQYYPLTYTTFWIEYHLWQLNPLGYHVVNLSLHALNAILAWLVLRQLGVKGAWVAAAIFALHPVQVESVAWATERKNVLSVFCYLGALLAYFRSRPDFNAAIDSHAPDATLRKPRLFYWLAFALFVCALLSKSVTCSLPVVILLLTWWKRGRLAWRDAYSLLPFFAMGIVVGLITMKLEGPERTFSLAERCLIAGRCLWFYIGKLLWPRKLAFVYPQWRINPSSWEEYGYPLGALGTILGLWALRGRWGREPLVAVLFFVVTLVPATGFFDIYYFRYSFVADHFQYLASIGVIALATAGGARLLRTQPAQAITTPIVLAVLAAFSSVRCQAFHDNETLWRDTLAKNPDAFLAHNNLGRILVEQRHDYAGGIAQFRETVRLQPNFPEAHNNLGVALASLGRYQEALWHLQEAARLRPDDGRAHYALGNLYVRMERFDEAAREYELVTQYSPTMVEARVNLGVLYYEHGQRARAITCYRAALAIDSQDVLAHYNLANALADDGEVDDAIRHYRTAVHINPRFEEAQLALGKTLIGAGRPQEAIEPLRHAIRLTPTLVEAYVLLATANADVGRFADAVGTLDEGLALAKAQNRPESVAEIQSRLSSYQKNELYQLASPKPPK
ncbi:MAG TPA: tetratricopeptide repeat protein [Verrucomicrobiae bacterium]|nr:tetratricopeptide repeat protein [Verrucomicrobiae bacterium]